MSAAIATWALVSARLAAILWVQVLWRTAVPGWGLAAVGLAGMLATLIEPSAALAGSSMEGLVVAAGFEVLLGLVIGLLATLPGYALVGATTMSASVLHAPKRPLVGLAVSLALAVALGIGLHRPLAGALLETFAIMPLAEPEAWLAVWKATGPATILRTAHAMLVLTLALATPVLLTAAVADLVTGLLARGPGPVAVAVAPLQPWLRTAAGILALGASWAAYGHAWADSVRILPR